MTFWSNENSKSISKNTKLAPGTFEVQISDKPLMNYSAFLTLKQIAVKVWLPDNLEQRFTELAKHFDQTRSHMVRVELFRHLYGTYCLEQMRELCDGLYGTDPNQLLFSRVPESVPRPKNIVNFKIWMPFKMQEDLLNLATKAGLTLSPYVREVLMYRFLGNVDHPEKLLILKELHSKNDDYPNDVESKEYPFV